MAAMTKTTKYVLCISNVGCDDLRLRQVYRMLPDLRSERTGLIRIVDDSGEDYLYPKANFARISIAQDSRDSVQRVFLNGNVDSNRQPTKPKLAKTK